MSNFCLEETQIPINPRSFGNVPTTPHPNTSAKASRYKWEAYRDTNWRDMQNFLQRGGHLFCKSIAIEMGGVSRYFSKVSGSRVDPSPPKVAMPINRDGGMLVDLRLLKTLFDQSFNIGILTVMGLPLSLSFQLCLSLYLSISPYTYIYIYLSLSPSLSLSLWLSLSLSVSLSLSLSFALPL